MAYGQPGRDRFINPACAGAFTDADYGILSTLMSAHPVHIALNYRFTLLLSNTFMGVV